MYLQGMLTLQRLVCSISNNGNTQWKLFCRHFILHRLNKKSVNTVFRLNIT